jgi:hypothetical protein
MLSFQIGVLETDMALTFINAHIHSPTRNTPARTRAHEAYIHAHARARAHEAYIHIHTRAHKAYIHAHTRAHTRAHEAYIHAHAHADPSPRLFKHKSAQCAYGALSRKCCSGGSKRSAIHELPRCVGVVHTMLYPRLYSCVISRVCFIAHGVYVVSCVTGEKKPNIENRL